MRKITVLLTLLILSATLIPVAVHADAPLPISFYFKWFWPHQPYSLNNLEGGKHHFGGGASSQSIGQAGGSSSEAVNHPALGILQFTPMAENVTENDSITGIIRFIAFPQILF
ncbi:MAG: hypothetical protein ABSF74_03805 [Dehalococcoidia bacterium]